MRLGSERGVGRLGAEVMRFAGKEGHMLFSVLMFVSKRKELRFVLREL